MILLQERARHIELSFLTFIVTLLGADLPTFKLLNSVIQESIGTLHTLDHLVLYLIELNNLCKPFFQVECILISA